MKLKLLAIIILFTWAGVNAQKVTTYLGRPDTAMAGVTSSSSKSIAGFNYPCAVGVDKNGYEWILEDAGNRLRMTISTFVVLRAGNNNSIPGKLNGSGPNAFFDGPKGLHILKDGRILIADEQNNCIREISPFVQVGTPQNVSTFAGLREFIGGYKDTIMRLAEFNYPKAMTSDSLGNIYVCDAGNNVIRKINQADSMVTTVAGNGLAGHKDSTALESMFTNPTDIVWYNNTLIVVDAGNKRIRKIDLTTNMVTTIAGDGNMETDDGSAETASFLDPSHVTVDNKGDIYVSDASANTIRKISNGTVSTFAGKAQTTGITDGTGEAARFNSPRGLFYHNGFIYVADAGSHTIRKIEILSAPSGLNEQAAAAVSLYPNPVKGQLYVEVTGTIEHYSMYDITGKAVIINTPVASSKASIDVAGISKGIYFLNLRVNGQQISRKVIID